MRSSFLATRPRLRRALPWALWLVAAVVAIPLAMSYTGYGSSPAVIEARVTNVAPIRTAHRLRIAKILVTPGQQVKAGDLLAQMDTTLIDADLAVAQAKLAYVEVLAGWKQVVLLNDRARTSHDLAIAAERASLDMARVVAEAERDRSELAQLDLNLDAEQKLVSDQLASSERLKAMKLQRAALAKKVEEYKAAVAQARKTAGGSSRRLGAWSKGIREPQSVSLADKAQDDVRGVSMELQRQEIARLQAERKECDLRAPFDGHVGEVLMHVGDLSADPGVPIVTLVEDSPKTAIAYLAQSDAQKIHVGDSARLVPRDLSGPALLGRVTAVAPNITEIPIRFRHVPTVHEFGRSVYITLDAPAKLPGQAFEAVFRRGGGT